MKRPADSIQNSATSLLAGAEGVEDLRHRVDALRRVAVLHLAADDRRAAREDALAFGVVAHLVVLVDERDVDGQRAQHQVELLQGQRAGVEREARAGSLGGAGRRDGGSPGVAAPPSPAATVTLGQPDGSPMRA